MAITNKMLMFGDKSEDIIIIEKILISLTPKFNFVVCAIEESKNIDDLSLDELHSSLLVHEQKLKQQDNEEQALKASIETLSSSKEVRGRDETFRNIVKFSNNSMVSVMGKGKITLQNEGDIIHTISNVLQLSKCGSVAREGQKNMVTGLPQIKNHSEICEDCVVGKQHRDSFPTGKSWRAKHVLELIHSDLCGSINLTSNGVFKNFKARVEKEADMPIKILRSDRGGEYNLHKRSKLDGKGEKYIFLDVCEQSKAYKLYNPITKKIVISRDVVFNEAEFWSHEECKPDQVERAQQIKRRFPWIEDYVVTGMEKSDDLVVHFALFADCDPVTFEEGQKAIDLKWVYKTKLNEKCEVDKYKTRLVAKGYKQEFDVDYKEVCAPVARHNTIRLVIALAAQNSCPIFQLDVKSTFLHGDLQEKVFVKQPPSYVKLDCENKVYKLKRALYGLKQAPRAWYSHIGVYFLHERFQKCPYEHTLFVKLGGDGKILIVCVYVDDLIYTGNDVSMFEKFKQLMMFEFDLSDLGKMHYFLGLEVVQSPFGDIDDRKSTLGYVFMLSSGAVSWSSKKQSIVTLLTIEAEFIAATSCVCQAIWLKKILEEL
ncbi:retrovirus-related Pol polyprotein from transposon TNT 1-94 [Cucumis melo var. makuwa]|uniref:Retrovirus-related Pol polyprotein from transposon TNT 1-94 n=1 Tax=Cucumis melo var. makuwa TaxID=1194695 RepID=A0A5D3CCP2_CUCMM|nr:retrovirus-related Pol polyprotein from transposon TNT 1-94 [Cucumis melo var. makuwa]TYK08958.1 retrovirus-related Pol polyprotein from transposon TNT 1-94 [Cucumis melo var. makuwa]